MHNATSIYERLNRPLLFFILIIGFLYMAQRVLMPLCFAGLLAILLMAPAQLFEKAGFPRGIASLISLILALMIFIIIFYFLSTAVVSFKQDLPVMIERLTNALTQLEEWAQKKFEISPRKMQEIIASTRESVIPSTAYIINTITSVTSTFFMTIIISIYTFLLLLYRSLIVKFFISIFEKQYSEKIYSIVAKTKFVIKSYIAGLFIEMLIVATANCTIFFILGVRYALLLGIISAIFNIIPYLGIFTACIISTLITFTTNSMSTAIGVTISLIIIHMIDSNVLMTRIVGSKVRLNALASIIGVVIGTAMWGIPGTFLAIPMMAILKVIFDDVEAFQPYSIIMGDDAAVPSASRHVWQRLTGSLRKSISKK